VPYNLIRVEITVKL